MIMGIELGFYPKWYSRVFLFQYRVGYHIENFYGAPALAIHLAWANILHIEKCYGAPALAIHLAWANILWTHRYPPCIQHLGCLHFCTFMMNSCPDHVRYVCWLYSASVPQHFRWTVSTGATNEPLTPPSQVKVTVRSLHALSTRSEVNWPILARGCGH